MTRKSVTEIQAMKRRAESIVMITAYDYASARLVDAEADVILVGDSLGMVVLGYDSTIPVTMEDMLHHTKAVVRGSEQALVVADLPFMSYQTSAEDAMRNAGRLLQEAGATAVKLEGGQRSAETVRRLVEAGVPVMGHIGLTPQSVNALGGYKVQGKTRREAQALLDDAHALQDAGVFSVVLETMPAPLARAISERIDVPTIGIGAGAGCDGQVQVYHDILSYATCFVPKHVGKYADVGAVVREAVARYAKDVRSGAFPTGDHSFVMDESVLRAIIEGAA